MAVDISDDVLICDEDANDVVSNCDIDGCDDVNPDDVIGDKNHEITEFLRIMMILILKRLQRKF